MDCECHIWKYNDKWNRCWPSLIMPYMASLCHSELIPGLFMLQALQWPGYTEHLGLRWRHYTHWSGVLVKPLSSSSYRSLASLLHYNTSYCMATGPFVCTVEFRYIMVNFLPKYLQQTPHPITHLSVSYGVSFVSSKYMFDTYISVTLVIAVVYAVSIYPFQFSSKYS